MGNNYLLSQKVSNLQGSSAILDDAVDGEVSVYCAHLVLETLGDDDLSESQEWKGNNLSNLCYTSNHVHNETFDRPQTSYMLSAALPYCECNLVRLALLQPDVHVDMADILVESTPRAFDSDQPGLDGDFHTLWDVEFFGLEDVPHLRINGLLA